MVRAGVPEKVAMAISGHKTRSIFDRYNVVDERDLEKAAKSLSAYFEEQKKVTLKRQKKFWSWREELNRPPVAGSA
ncbi:hypothetical protein W02_42840 [Nitrospira sp. KM1]|nr:hypothetical protein W02_42840 [Nitrospira sp. KM1]